MESRQDQTQWWRLRQKFGCPRGHNLSTFLPEQQLNSPWSWTIEGLNFAPQGHRDWASPLALLPELHRNKDSFRRLSLTKTLIVRLIIKTCFRRSKMWGGVYIRLRKVQSNFGFYHECRNSLPRVSSRSFSFQARRRPTRTDPAPSCRRPILWNPRWLWRGRMPSCPFLRDPSPAVGCEERGWQLRRLLRNTKWSIIQKQKIRDWWDFTRSGH